MSTCILQAGRQTDPIPLTWLLRMPRVSGLLFPDLGRLDTGRTMPEPGLMLTLRLSVDWPVWSRSSCMADRKQMVACSSLSPQPASRTFLSTSSTFSEHESISGSQSESVYQYFKVQERNITRTIDRQEGTILSNRSTLYISTLILIN
jgi:hypothetical protein